jgi:hypothetical protein
MTCVITSYDVHIHKVLNINYVTVQKARYDIVCVTWRTNYTTLKITSTLHEMSCKLRDPTTFSPSKNNISSHRIHPFNDSTAQIGHGPPPLRFLNHTELDSHGRTPLDEWSARSKGLYLHRTTQQINTTDKHPCPQRHRTHDPCNQAAVDLRFRPRGHWDRLYPWDKIIFFWRRSEHSCEK